MCQGVARTDPQSRPLRGAGCADAEAQLRTPIAVGGAAGGMPGHENSPRGGQLAVIPLGQVFRRITGPMGGQVRQI
eukprot:SAG31_NODE_17402_length_672_cov_0.905759_1_plen_76_part_00